MTNNTIERFNDELDQLLGLVPAQPPDQGTGRLVETDLASEALPPVELAARWAQQTRKGDKRTMNPRMKLLVACVLVVIVLVMAFVSMPGVVRALQHLFGYLPGIGVVDETAMPRKLAQAVSQTRAGITVTVDQVMLTSDITSIHLKVQGIPDSAYPPLNADGAFSGNQCGTEFYLRYPDGTASKDAGFNGVGGGAKVSEYELTWTVSPVPAAFDTAVLVMHCILQLRPGAAPENWELPLHFVPATAADFAPVTEIPTPLSTLQPTQPVLTPTPTATGLASVKLYPASEDITLTLDKVVSLPDGDMFYGRLKWDKNARFSVMGPSTIPEESLTDADGQAIQIESLPPDSSAWTTGMLGTSVYPLQFKLDAPIHAPGPVTLTVKDVKISMAGGSFVFDAGPHPQVGQQWHIDQDFQIGGRPIRAVAVTLLADGYDFTFQTTSPGVVDVFVFIKDHNYASAQPPENNGEAGLFHFAMAFDGKQFVLPTGVLTVTFGMDFDLTGPWQVIWQR